MNRVRSATLRTRNMCDTVHVDKDGPAVLEHPGPMTRTRKEGLMHHNDTGSPTA